MSATRVACFALPFSPLPTPRRAIPVAVKLLPPREPCVFLRASSATAAIRHRVLFRWLHETVDRGFWFLTLSPFRLLVAAADAKSRLVAADASAEVGNEVPKSVPVAVAYELLKSGHQYLDVRTVEEFSAGHAVGAVNIPYMLNSSLGRTKNTSFLQEVSSTFGKDDKVVVGCLSGKRSLMAASELTKAGFTVIIDVGGGYSSWVQNGLPTEK